MGNRTGGSLNDQTLAVVTPGGGGKAAEGHCSGSVASSCLGLTGLTPRPAPTNGSSARGGALSRPSPRPMQSSLVGGSPKGDSSGTPKSPPAHVQWADGYETEKPKGAEVPWPIDAKQQPRNSDMSNGHEGAPREPGKGAGSDVEDVVVVEEVSAVPTFNMPILVRAVGAILAFNAGLINSVAFFELGWFVSHQTGTFSKVGFGNMEALYLLASFVFGSATCGLFIAKDTVHIGLALYDFGLLSISGLLVAATLCHHNQYAKFFAAAACGLQNGMATHWGGAVVRTTHVTGLFTDVGLLIGRLASITIRKRFGKRFDVIDRVEVIDNARKLSFLTMLAICFLVGIIAGEKVHNQIHEYAFLFPACVVGVLGLAYLFHRVCVLGYKLFSDAEMEVVDVPVEAVVVEEECPMISPNGQRKMQNFQERGCTASNMSHMSDGAHRRIYFATGKQLSKELFDPRSNFRSMSRDLSSRGSSPRRGSLDSDDSRLAAPVKLMSMDMAEQVHRRTSPSGGALGGAGERLRSQMSGEFVAVSRRCAIQRQEHRNIQTLELHGREQVEGPRRPDRLVRFWASPQPSREFAAPASPDAGGLEGGRLSVISELSREMTTPSAGPVVQHHSVATSV